MGGVSQNLHVGAGARVFGEAVLGSLHAERAAVAWRRPLAAALAILGAAFWIALALP